MERKRKWKLKQEHRFCYRFMALDATISASSSIENHQRVSVSCFSCMSAWRGKGGMRNDNAFAAQRSNNGTGASVGKYINAVSVQFPMSHTPRRHCFRCLQSFVRQRKKKKTIRFDIWPGIWRDYPLRIESCTSSFECDSVKSYYFVERAQPFLCESENEWNWYK